MLTELARLSVRVSARLSMLSHPLSRHYLRPVGMGIMHSIRSEIDTILRKEIELAQKDEPALIVRSAFEVIEDFLSQGMSLERIASALQKHDIKITKGHLVRHLGIVREERGRKSKAPGTSVPAPSAWGHQSQLIAPAKAANAEPSPAPAIRSDSAAVASELGHAYAEPDMPVAKSTDRTDTPNIEVQRVGGNQTVFPDEITRLKFIEVKGEWLDVTRMNIDDYLTVSKTIPANAKIPDGMFEVIAAENRIRGMYERALLQYDAAIVKWKSSQ